jgi:hypothetical protein
METTEEADVSFLLNWLAKGQTTEECRAIVASFRRQMINCAIENAILNEKPER